MVRSEQSTGAAPRKDKNSCSPPREGCRGGLSPTGRTHPEGYAFCPSREGICTRVRLYSRRSVRLERNGLHFQKYGYVFHFHSCSYSCSCSASADSSSKSTIMFSQSIGPETECLRKVFMKSSA